MSDPAVQALVAGSPVRFHREETRTRAEAGFPPGVINLVHGRGETAGRALAEAPDVSEAVRTKARDASFELMRLKLDLRSGTGVLRARKTERLRQARAVCAAGGPGGGILIGVDRVKDTAVLEPAYDDPLGVTAAFNRNLLLHVNALLGSDFAPARWRHVAFYNAAASRIEMHLASDGVQTVRWPGGERRFADGERLHTENSYKWTPEAFEALLREAGFGAATHWSDARGWFSVFWAPAA